MRHLVVNIGLGCLLTLCFSQPACSSAGRDSDLPGTTTTGCTKDTDCKGDRLCVNGQCESPVGTDGGIPIGTPDGGTASCQTKYDCAAGQACVHNQCSATQPGGGCSSDAQCARGAICVGTTCQLGCSTTPDCSTPQICNAVTATCVTCSRTNQCPAGQACLGGACLAAPSCSGGTCRTAFREGSVCVGQYCGNCRSDSDCNVAPYSNDSRAPFTCSTVGLCTSSTAGCTDAQCKQQGDARLSYCDSATQQCSRYACVDNTDCSGGAACNRSAHLCVAPDGGSGCPSDCDTSCQQQGMTCDHASCQCASSGGDGGTSGCTVDGDCGSDLTCLLSTCVPYAVLPTGAPCDFTACSAGACVSSKDSSILCSQIGCFLGNLGGSTLMPCQ